MNKVIILDFGSQYTQLIARRIRELNIYSEIHPFDKCPEITSDIKGVILSGSKNSVNAENPYVIDLDAIATKVPILGICYGSQLITYLKGGKVVPSAIREYGRAHINIIENELFAGINVTEEVWMSHSDTISVWPEEFTILASTNDIPVAAFKINNSSIYGLQFHPEVSHTSCGNTIFKNFLYEICKIKPEWTPDNYINETILSLRSTILNDKVLLALSGGVDSTVVASLLHKAIGKNLVCVFVDNGLLRKNEFQEVLKSYKEMGLNIHGIDAKELFYNNLKDIEDPEQKRKIIGKTFIDVFEDVANDFADIKYLAQGTIYPDVIESFGQHSSTIKSHHNVGGLPEKMKLKIIEPLRLLFKDEVRKVGRSLMVPNNILERHPFPGPGLAIRILGAVSKEKVNLLQAADAIFINNLKEAGLYNKIWQAGVILLPVKSVGVMGDERTYENCVALRAVESIDGMTADWYPIPYELLGKISNEIINQVKGINRVVFDISSKPPATIEWE